MFRLKNLLSEESVRYFTPEQMDTHFYIPEVICDPCEGQDKGYNKSFKCCTYFPFVPNYRAASVFAKINHGLITPLGVFPTKRYRDEFALNKFGRNAKLGCPLYVEGKCSVWKSRPAECQMYFCKPYAEKTVKQSVQKYMNEMEMGLAQLAALYAGSTIEDIKGGIESFNDNKPYKMSVDAQKFFSGCAEAFGEHSEGWIEELQQDLSFLLEPLDNHRN